MMNSSVRAHEAFNVSRFAGAPAARRCIVGIETRAYLGFAKNTTATIRARRDSAVQEIDATEKNASQKIAEVSAQFLIPRSPRLEFLAHDHF